MGKHESGYPRVDKDFYPTPSWVTNALAEHVELAGLRVWEPACGTGQMADALRAAGARVHATDIEDRGYSGFDGVFDFTSMAEPNHKFDTCITNPPYGERGKLAKAFIEAGLRRINIGSCSRTITC